MVAPYFANRSPHRGAGPLLEPAGVPTSFIPDTNAIESVNARVRKAVKARGHFPTETAALKCVYMALMSLDPTGTGRQRWIVRWKAPLNAFAIAFPGRIIQSTK